MPGQVERVLEEIGQSLRPISEAPKDRRWILAKSDSGFVICRWDNDPEKLAGPCWVEAQDAALGYLDKSFSGWIEPSRLKLWDYGRLADLLIAFVDDARAAGDAKTLALLEQRIKAE
jgi:hypothetical protein